MDREGRTTVIQFLLNGKLNQLTSIDPTMTVLELLRSRLRLTGTKEGCAEGDCGACTVLLGDLTDGDRLVWRAVNACILFVPMLDGKALLTVESLGGQHPVQRELVERHGSQCGFCTPGFVMSLVGRSMAAMGTQSVPVADVISGNLCRCTGYGPILAAGEAVPEARRDDSATITALRTITRTELLKVAYDDPLVGTRRFAFVARTADALAALLIEHPDARLIAGATDVGLWVTKQQRVLPTAIFIGDIADLRTIEETDQGLRLGAGVRYSEAWQPLARLHPALGELVRRIAGTQVRNAGTIGGNIANASPIGDTPPALIALGANLTLRRGNERRVMPLEAFFLSYGKQDRRPGEFVESIFVPRPKPGAVIRVDKLSKRFDSDISAVCGAIALRVEAKIVLEARVAFGGMAGTPQRARACEAVLIGQQWSGATIEAAVAALAEDYQPLTDVRGSAAYRLVAAANLLRRFWLEQAGEPVSVLELANG
ncbi:MAG: xanthine dehydrogenase small subunit [Sphingomonadaceae bacterium]|nr:xanthine dehydrogenase small subunit [Sphingomonadaceae bacterium]